MVDSGREKPRHHRKTIRNVSRALRRIGAAESSSQGQETFRLLQAIPGLSANYFVSLLRRCRTRIGVAKKPYRWRS